MNTKRAREMRQNVSHPERAMWRLLKPFRDRGFHFRRQVPLGKYYADFACHGEKLVIEVDGDGHVVGSGPEHDKERDAYIRGREFEVLRFSNRDVLNNPKGVFEVIEMVLSKRAPTLDPSPQGRGRQEK